jgi:hypothetical protein
MLNIFSYFHKFLVSNPAVNNLFMIRPQKKCVFNSPWLPRLIFSSKIKIFIGKLIIFWKFCHLLKLNNSQLLDFFHSTYHLANDEFKKTKKRGGRGTYCPRFKVLAPHVCRKRRLNWKILQMRTWKPKAWTQYHYRDGTIKIPPCSHALSTEH